jgi:excisionase family DNA binding protein
MNELLTTGDVARICEIPYITAYNWVKSGKIKAQRTPGGHYRIRRCDVVEFLEGYGFPVSDDLKPWRKRRILIVSEQPDDLKRMLQSADGVYQVTSVNDGFSAGFKVMSSSPDLLILDSLMLDGVTVCKLIKAHPKTMSIKILCLTASAEQLIPLLQAGAEDCLVQPISPTKLKKRVRSLLDTL